MALYIDPATGEKFENDAPDAADKAVKFGLVPAEKFEADQKLQDASGGVTDVLRTPFEEVSRKVAAGVAAGVRGVTGLAQEGVDALSGPAPAGLTDEAGSGNYQLPGQNLQGSDLVPAAFTPEALARREANPIASDIGGAAPYAVADVLALVTGGASIAATLGLDAADAGAQAALEAELEHRGVSGEDFLRHAGMNVLFSAGRHAAGALLKGAGGALRGAEEYAGRVGTAKALAGGVEDATDEASQVLARRADEALATSDAAIESVKGPKIAANGASQREALDGLADTFEREQPALAAQLRELPKAGRAGMYDGLQKLSADATGETQAALDKVRLDPSLWGQAILDHGDALDAAKALRETAAQSPENLRSYSDALRKLGLEKESDALDHIAERTNQTQLGRSLKSVGAAGNGPDIIPRAFHDAVNDPKLDAELMRDLHTVAGGGNGEKGALQELKESMDQVMSNAEKRKDFSAAAPTDPAAQSRLEGFRRESIDKLTKVADDLRAQGFASKADLVEQHVKNLGEVELKDIAGAADRSKQLLDRIHVQAQNSATANELDRITDIVDPTANHLRAGLENPDFVGQTAATLQAERNAAWSGPDGIIRAGKEQRALGYAPHKFLERDYHTGEISTIFDRRQLDSLATMQPHQSKPIFDAIFRELDGYQNVLNTNSEIGLKSADRAPLVAAQKALTEAREVYTTLATRAEAKAQGAILAPGEDLAAGLAGKAARLVPFVGEGARDIVEPIVRKAVRGLDQARGAAVVVPERTGSKALRSIQKYGLAGVVAAGALGLANPSNASAAQAIANSTDDDNRTTARLLVNPDAAERYLKSADRVPSAAERWQGDDEHPEQTLQRYRQQLAEYKRNPEALIDLLSEAFGDIDKTAPRIHAAMTQQALAIVSYLQTVLPGQRNVSVAYPHGTPASAVEMRQFALYAGAALDPNSVLADARAGRLRREQVVTLQKLWPKTYDGLRTSVLEELGNGSTTVSRQRMNILFGFGSSVDPALGPRVSALVAAARKDQGAPKQGASGGPTMTSESPPSKAGLTPSGMSALQLGPSLDA